MRFVDECSWGLVSRQHIAKLDPRLALICNTVIRVIPRRLDHKLTCSFRGKDEQELAFKTGVSEKRWPESKHNRFPATALDFLPLPFESRDWQDFTRFGRIIGFYEAVSLELDIPIITGSDWDMDGKTIDHKLQDLCHIELR